METINGYVLTFLINSLWQVAVVAATAIGCAKLLRRAPARFQHLLWVSALLLSVGLPLYSLLQKPEDRIFNFISQTNFGAAQTETNSAIQIEENAVFSEKFFGSPKFFRFSRFDYQRDCIRFLFGVSAFPRLSI